MTKDQFIKKWRPTIPPAIRHEFAADLGAIDRGPETTLAKNARELSKIVRQLSEKVRKQFPDDPQTAETVCRILMGKRPD